MKHLLHGTASSVLTKNKAKQTEHNNKKSGTKAKDDDSRSKTSRDHQQNLRNLVETWMKRGSELAARKEYYEALEEFKTLQERLLAPELARHENSSTSHAISSRFLWATRQNADVDVVVGRLHERLGQEEEAAQRYKQAYITFEKLPDLCLQQRKEMQLAEHYQHDQNDDHRSRVGHKDRGGDASTVKTKGKMLRRSSGLLSRKNAHDSKSTNKSQIQNHKALVFHADTQSILVLEAMGSLAVKRNKSDLATEFYDMVDDLIRKTEVKYGVAKLDGHQHKEGGRQLPDYDDGDDDDDASSSYSSSEGSMAYSATDDLREYRKDRAKRIQHVKRLVEQDRSRTSKIFASQMEKDDDTVLGMIGNTLMKWMGDK